MNQTRQTYLIQQPQLKKLFIFLKWLEKLLTLWDSLSHTHSFGNWINTNSLCWNFCYLISSHSSLVFLTTYIEGSHTSNHNCCHCTGDVPKTDFTSSFALLLFPCLVLWFHSLSLMCDVFLKPQVLEPWHLTGISAVLSEKKFLCITVTTKELENTTLIGLKTKRKQKILQD